MYSRKLFLNKSNGVEFSLTLRVSNEDFMTFLSIASDKGSTTDYCSLYLHEVVKLFGMLKQRFDYIAKEKALFVNSQPQQLTQVLTNLYTELPLPDINSKLIVGFSLDENNKMKISLYIDTEGKMKEFFSGPHSVWLSLCSVLKNVSEQWFSIQLFPNEEQRNQDNLLVGLNDIEEEMSPIADSVKDYSKDNMSQVVENVVKNNEISETSTHNYRRENDEVNEDKPPFDVDGDPSNGFAQGILNFENTNVGNDLDGIEQQPQPAQNVTQPSQTVNNRSSVEDLLDF